MTDPVNTLHVFVTVGTDVHPFPRLLGWVADIAAEHPGLARFTAQRGWTAAPPGLETVDFLDHAALVQAMSGADVVVSHGGPSTVAEARRVGRRPVVVPRDPAAGEHVDNHQVLFTRRLAESGLVTLAESREDLLSVLQAAADYSADRYVVADTAAERAAAVATFAREAAALVEPRVRRARRRFGGGRRS